MIALVSIHEGNWREARSLAVTEEQERYLDSAVGILARGYLYRADRARVIGIADRGRLVGLALVKDLDEEPACYDLQQFMIDRRFQKSGRGTRALEMILARLRSEGKYENVEVCVDRSNGAALRLFEKAGFFDTGYLDESAPESLNLRCRLKTE